MSSSEAILLSGPQSTTLSKPVFFFKRGKTKKKKRKRKSSHLRCSKEKGRQNRLVPLGKEDSLDDHLKY